MRFRSIYNFEKQRLFYIIVVAYLLLGRLKLRRFYDYVKTLDLYARIALSDDELFVVYNANDTVDFTSIKEERVSMPRVWFLRDAQGSLRFSGIFRLFMTIQGFEYSERRSDSH